MTRSWLQPGDSQFSAAGGPTTRLAGLPGPQNSPGRVLVAVQHQPARGTETGTRAQALLDARPTPATVLAGIGRFDQHDSLASPFCLAQEEGAELRPTGITDALDQTVVAAKLATRRSSQVEDIVQTAQHERRLVVEIPPLTPHLFEFLGEHLSGLVMALTALLASSEPFLRLAIVAWSLYRCALCGDEKHLQPHVDSGLASSDEQRLSRHVGAGEGDVPAARCAREGDRKEAFARRKPLGFNPRR